MPDEKPIPMPLSGEEVQEAIMYRIQESLSKTCHLKHDNAYTSFHAKIKIELTLSDYGREVKDNHAVEVLEDSSVPAESEPHTEEATVTMEPKPPNQVRIESAQGVPVVVNEGGKRLIKSLKYAARKSSKTGQQP